MWMVYLFRWWTKFCFKYDWVSIKNVCPFRLLSCDIRSVDTRLTKVIYNYINPNKTVQKSVLTKETVFMASSNILFHLSVTKSLIIDLLLNPLINNNQQFHSCILRPFKGCFCILQHLSNQDVSHCFDVLVTIISTMSIASLPHVLESSWCPLVPKPIRESQLPQSFSLFPRIPILALDQALWIPTTLNPSLLQLGCKEAREPMRFFHVLRPSEVARYLSSAISEYRDLAWWLMTRDLNCWPIFIPRQILLNGVFQ